MGRTWPRYSQKGFVAMPKIDPKVVKMALRIVGTMLTSLKAVVPGIWGNLLFIIGTNMVTYSLNPPGSVSKWDFTAILNAARSVVPVGSELRIRSVPPPVKLINTDDSEITHPNKPSPSITPLVK